MKTKNNNELIQEIINSNGGYITRRDINNHNIPSVFLYQYVKKHNLIKYGTGFYAKEEWFIDEFLIFQYEYPKLVYSFYTAAYLNQLGDYLPTFLEVTGPKNYRPFPLPKEGVSLHTDTRDSTYSLGITNVKTMYGNIVKVYDMEKTVCDFIRNRDKIDSEAFVKCINWYKRKKSINRHNLMKYAQIMKIEDEVHKLMEVVLNED